MRSLKHRLALAALLFGVVSCSGGSPSGPSTPNPPPVGGDVVFVGAGDIGWCTGGPRDTGLLLDAFPDALVFTTGDNAYPDGSVADFQNCYDPFWGRFKDRTRPTPGNHDYHTENATPYFNYFGENAGPYKRGYYSYTLGSWHAVALDSTISIGEESAQLAWLAADLKLNPAACTVVYWHTPLYSSGPNGPSPKVRPVWRILYANAVDLVLNGHDHLYERFAPQDPDGGFDPAKGIRQFTVGTGGGPLYDVKSVTANSEVRAKMYGILRLTLKSGSYDWRFIPTVAGLFNDSGTGSCH